MQDFTFEHALLPTGWARNVRVLVEAGTIVSVTRDSGKGRGIAIPGMPNLHSHTFQRAMAGRAEIAGTGADSFWTWRKTMYDSVDRLTPDDVEAIASFAFMEMLERGFTGVAEFHYLHHDLDGTPYANLAEHCVRIAEAAGQSGIGLTLLPVLYTYAGFGQQDAEHGQRRFLNGVDRFANLLDGARRAVAPLRDAVVGVAPHSLRAVGPDDLARVLELAAGNPIHIHIAEQTKEVADCLAWSGRRPVQWLAEHVELGPQWCLIHATHMEPDEIAAVARSGAVVGLCPLTEANLGDGIFAGRDHAAQGGRLGVGSDSNVEITAPGELKQLEYSQRLALRQRNVMATPQTRSTGRALFDAAVAGGTQALGRGPATLTAGQRADIVVLELDVGNPGLAGMSGDQWLDAYVFVAGAGLIDRVIAGGELVVEGGRHHLRDVIATRYAKVLARLCA